MPTPSETSTPIASLSPPKQQASRFALYACFSYVGIILYASLYPFVQWSGAGVSPFAWVTAPWPRYVSQFDNLSNVIGYMPFGVLTVWALFPKLRGALAVLVATCAGSALSFCMESLQTWLPQRVASNLDWGTNTLGTFMGAILCLPLVTWIFADGRLRQMRHQWFSSHTSFGLILMLLWPFAQIFPQAWLFGTGDILRVWWQQPEPMIAESLRSMLPNIVTLREALNQDAETLLHQQWWETGVTAISWLAAGLMISVPMRSHTPKLRFIFSVLVIAVTMKSAAMALQFNASQVFIWLTPGASTGLLLGSGLLLLALWLPRWARAIVAMLALLMSITAVNILPPSPYYLALLQGWRQGRFIQFNGMAQWLGWIWPYLAFAWLAFWMEAHLTYKAQLLRRRNTV